MSRERVDVAASIRQRLLDLSRGLGEDHQAVLTRFALERLLARLAASELRDHFVLKGALLFALWSDRPHRATRDLDLLGRGSPSIDDVVASFRTIVATSVEADGLCFDAAAITGKPIREAARYEGVRLTIPASLGKTRFRLQVDIGFGDAVEPRPRLVDYPALLGHAQPRIKAYPPEAVVAEKLEAMVRLGLVNSRMKDIHDLWTLARTRAFDGPVLARSIEVTFRRRATPLPLAAPVTLTDVFAQDASRRTLWAAFLGRADLDEPRELSDAIVGVARFAQPILDAIASGREWTGSWDPGGPWTLARR
ncbi:MAG: nucleotidyl transferase AbiEii/AbiGii toxin family protein [Planctomycetes bacterium]|nr:nucleotidyl transferase AbiEii/AbiGii toxin family protein [Planctomycetota bacterium]